LFAGDEVGADVILVQGDAEAGRIGELDVAVLDEGNAGETEASQKYVAKVCISSHFWLSPLALQLYTVADDKP